MTDVQVLLMFLFLDSKMAKQQLQKWELKFVTELEPLEGASPVCLCGEKIGLLWKNVWLHVLKLWKDEWLGFILSVGPEVFVSTSISKYEKNDSKLAPILGAGKRLPKWESAPLLLQK